MTWQPKIIKSLADYEDALAEAEKIFETDTEDAGNIELVLLLIENFETKRFKINFPDPISAIKFRMEQQGLKQKDLVKYIGSKSRVSEILSGKRRLTVEMIRNLHHGLGIPLESLIGGNK